MIRWALALTAAAALGFATAAVSAPGPHHPVKRCHRWHHHRRCKKPGSTSTTGSSHPTQPPAGGTTTQTTTTPATTSGSGSTTTSGSLPTRLEVDENDQGQGTQPYSLWPSHNPVAAGTVEFNVYNFGQDPHTFAVVDSHGDRLAFAQVPANQPETAVPVHVSLPPGSYTLECTLPGHASLGMVATITVK